MSTRRKKNSVPHVENVAPAETAVGDTATAAKAPPGKTRAGRKGNMETAENTTKTSGKPHKNAVSGSASNKTSNKPTIASKPKPKPKPSTPATSTALEPSFATPVHPSVTQNPGNSNLPALSNIGADASKGKNKSTYHKNLPSDDEEDEEDEEEIAPTGEVTELATDAHGDRPPNSDEEDEVEPTELGGDRNVPRALSAPPSPQRAPQKAPTRKRQRAPSLIPASPPRKLVVRETTVSPGRTVPLPSRIKKARAFVISEPVFSAEDYPSSPPPDDGEEGYSTESDSDDDVHLDKRDYGRDLNVNNAGRKNKLRYCDTKFYKPRFRPFLLDARERYRHLILHRNVFPTLREKELMASDAWKHASIAYARRNKAKVFLTFNRDKVTLLNVAAALTRSRVKAAAQTLVPQGYQLLAHLPDHNPVDFTKDRVAELLTNGAFLYDPSWTNDLGESRRVRFTHPMMVAVLYEGLIKHLDGEALRAVTPLPNSVIALVATGIESALEEYRQGNKVDIQFTEKAYRLKYTHWVQKAQKLHKDYPIRADNIFHDMLTDCLTRKASNPEPEVLQNDDSSDGPISEDDAPRNSRNP